MTAVFKTLPKRVLLRGFPDDSRAAAAAWLQEQGVETVNLPSLADLVVAGPEADAALLQRASVKAAKIIPWDELKAVLLAVKAGPGKAKGVPCSEGDGDQAGSPLADYPILDGKALEPIERGAGFLRILDLTLPVGTESVAHPGLIPNAEQFAHLCLDKPFLETLRAVALGVLYGLPVALEGDTAASKTSAVLYLAHLMGQPAVRLNLSGHTDAGELVGRYVPTDAAAMIPWGELQSSSAWLKADSQKILKHAHASGRQLNNVERMGIIGREQFPVSGWNFQEGYLPQAMRHGWWILLDEMNLAETQVLERLNCVLDNPPSLVLTEGSGAVFGRHGDVPVHTAFRILSTMNPSDYAGRAVLSQAFADRWAVWHQANGPGEREIEQMLRCLVFGEQPRFVIAGQSYKADSVEPVYAELQAIPDIGALLQRVAVFHHGIFRAAGGGGNTPSIGRLKKERYSFSRRILLTLMRFVADRIRMGAAPEESLISNAIQALYVARVRDEADRKAVNNILRAGGLL